jgi:hypothetical protein
MPGTQIFTYANVGKETVRGTPVAPTRKLYAAGTGVLDVDPSLNFHEKENRGVRTRIARATQQGENVALKMSYASGVGYDDLVVPVSQLKGGLTGTGAGADKSWTFVSAMAAANNPESYSVDVGDDVQNWRVQYGMVKSFKLSAARGDVTGLDMEWFGQRAIKGAKATPADNSAVKIPGDLWTIKFAATQAGLTGAAIQTNFLLDWTLDVDTGLIWRDYMDGNLYGSQHVETDIAGKLALTVESTALAVSEFYDKWLTQTLDFIRLKATGPVLGSTNYSCQIDLPVLFSKVSPIGGEDEGINLYKIEANLAYDPTSAASIQGILVNSLAALP